MDPLIDTGHPAPVFTLLSLDGRVYQLDKQRGRVVILNFWSAECPWAERGDQELLSYLSEWGDRAVLWTIASNANESPAMLASVAAQRSLPIVLHDHKQQVADLYGAMTTPHLYAIDAQGILRYQGALNNVTFRQRIPTQHYLWQAVEAILAGQDPDPKTTLPYGCTIVRHLA